LSKNKKSVKEYLATLDLHSRTFFLPNGLAKHRDPLKEILGNSNGSSDF